MKIFRPGTKVIRIETGERGIVREQFIDGYVSLMMDDGPAELDSESLVEAPQATEEAPERPVDAR